MSLKHWYLVHTYSGSEKKAKLNLEERVKSLGMQDRILNVIQPVDYKVKIKNGKRKIEPEKVFAGYLLVELVLDDEVWYVIQNTPGILGFVGPAGKPTPLTDEEANQIMQRVTEEEAIAKLNFEIGDTVRIVGGPFDEMEGVVESINHEKEKARIRLEMFGREMPVEIEFGFIEKI